MKGQMRQAERVGARTTVIVGDGIKVKDMESREQRSVDGLDEVLEIVKAAASS
jgi:histidyl-tRNA synthetase